MPSAWNTMRTTSWAGRTAWRRPPSGRLPSAAYRRAPPNDALLADIILPVNTKLEEDDIAIDNFSGQFNLRYPEEKCIDPLAESYSDYEITCMLAEQHGRGGD